MLLAQNKAKTEKLFLETLLHAVNTPNFQSRVFSTLQKSSDSLASDLRIVQIFRRIWASMSTPIQNEGLQFWNVYLCRNIIIH